MIDLRSDLMGPRPAGVMEAMGAAAGDRPAMLAGEDRHEQALSARLAEELGVEAVLLVPTCTMANQIAIRLHLPEGGCLASMPFSHIVTVEARATALTGVTSHPLAAINGHPTPDAVAAFCAERANAPSLVWLENTHMLSAGSIMPEGWQDAIASACHPAGCALHLDGSRLWNAAVAQNAPLSSLTVGCDTISISLNKAIGAPLGSVIAGSRTTIDAAVRWREALGGEWRPIGSVAAAALAALDGWRDRLSDDMAMTHQLAAEIGNRLGEAALQPAPTNLIFLNRPAGDSGDFVAALLKRGIQAISVTPGIVRLAIHSGVREQEVAAIADAVTFADLDLAEAA